MSAAPLLGDIHRSAAATTPEAAAVIVGADRDIVTYADLEDAVAGVARTLTGHGLHRGDVIAVLAPNTVEFIVAVLGAARAGMIVAPMDPALPESGIRQRLDMIGARVVLTGPVPTGAYAGSIGDCPVWTVTGVTVEPGPVAPRVARPPAGVTADDAMIMFTSGTTGTPKMVPWTRQAIGAVVATIARTYRLSADDATVAVMPLFHGHGLVAALLTTLSVGGTVLLPAAGRFSAHTFWDDMAAAGATWYTAVPTIHRIVLGRTEDSGSGDHGAVTGLRFIRSCSAPLSPEIATRMEAVFGVPVLAAYGMTEATHHVTGCVPDDDVAIRRGTVGRPVGATARTVDGEIRLSGPTIARGYLGDPALSAGVLDGGWLRTGDLGAVDGHGNLAVTGRIKNIINRAGEKISPEHVEQALVGTPGVAQAAVFPLPDPVYGERVAAAVVLTPGSHLTTDDLLADSRTRLAGFEVPDHVAVVGQLPLTAKGDVDRAALATLVTTQRDRG